MATLLQKYEQARQELMNQLDELLPGLQNAGIGTVGDYENKIEIVEKGIRYYDKKIAEQQLTEMASGNAKGASTVLIYVITGTSARIKNALAEENIYNAYFSVQPPTHDEEDRRKWIPFSNELVSIKGLLDQLAADGYRFKVYYLDGYAFADYAAAGYEFATDAATLEAAIDEFIDDNIGKIVAIVDLLAIDADNAKIAQRFNRKDSLRVITPICSYLPDAVKSFMVAKRKEAFKLLEFKIFKDEISSLDVAYERSFLRNELVRILKRESPAYNKISGLAGNASAVLPTLNPSILLS